MSAKPSPDRMPDRMTPYDKAAEKAVLGSLLRDNGAVWDAANVLRPESFYTHAHQLLFGAITELVVKRGGVADAVTVADLLHGSKQIADIGGYGYFVELWESAPSAGNALHYAGIVKEFAIKRAIIHAGQDVSKNAYEPGVSAQEALAFAEQSVLRIGDQQSPVEAVPIEAAVREMLSDLERRMEHGVATDGVKTPWPTVNEIIVEFRRGGLSVIGARPAVGKTTLLLNVARHLIENDASVLFCSLEMSRRELSECLVCMDAQIPKTIIRKAMVQQINAKKQSLLDAAARIQSGRLNIDDATGQTVFRIGAIARRMQRGGGLDAVLVDYLQLVDSTDFRARRHEQVDGVARDLKKLAMALQVPVIAAAQLNRESEGRSTPRPKLSDLRESGGIEQHADLVCLLHCEADQIDFQRRPTEVIVAKNRHGPTGSATLIFDRPTGMIVEQTMDQSPTTNYRIPKGEQCGN